MKRTKQRHALRQPPKPDFNPTVEMQIINTDIAFDEIERKKFDALAEPFLSESVSNLPQTLEETINNYHNENAESLVLNKTDLANAKETLSQVLEKLCVSLESAKVTRSNEQTVSEKLRSIDLNSDKDATVVLNKQEAAKLLMQIYEDASVPTEWESLLGHPRLSAINHLPHLYEVLMQLTNEITTDKVPQSLVGLRVAKERMASYTALADTFQSALLTFINNTFTKYQVALAFANQAPPVEFRPVENDGDEPQKYSIPETRDHPLLKCISLYSQFVNWARIHYYEDCYLQLEKIYLNCATQYLNTVVGSQFLDQITTIQTMLREKPYPTDPFCTDDEYKSGHSTLVVTKINEILGKFFSALRIEACVLTEFWKITDPQILSQMISKTMIEYMKALMEATKTYDPLYVVVSYRIVSSEETKSIIPLESLLQIPRDKWNNYIKKQINDLKNTKVTKNKTVVLKVFKDLPLFIKALCFITPKEDMTILEKTVIVILDELVYYLTEHVIAKFSKRSKRSRMIILNLAYLSDSLKDETMLRQSQVISEKLDSVDKLLKENVDAFLNQMAAGTWTEAFTFFNQIDSWMKQEAFTYEMVTFQISHTEDKFKELNEKIDKNIAKSVNECFTFMKKKIRDDDLRTELRKSVVINIKQLFQNWSDMAEKCYGMKLTTTPEKVVQLMNEHP